jgi:hypothetical protein
MKMPNQLAMVMQMATMLCDRVAAKSQSSRRWRLQRRALSVAIRPSRNSSWFPKIAYSLADHIGDLGPP